MGLMHKPPLVFLDEPTTGLDPQARANLWAHIKRLRDDHQTTVFLTTHYLDEADALCDRILVIDHGKIVATGTPEELKQRVSGDRISLSLARSEDAALAVKVAGTLAGADQPIVEGKTVVFHIPHGGAVIPGLLKELDVAGVELVGVEVRRPTLDDVFLTMTGHSLRDGEPA